MVAFIISISWSALILLGLFSKFKIVSLFHWSHILSRVQDAFWEPRILCWSGEVLSVFVKTHFKIPFCLPYLQFYHNCQRLIYMPLLFQIYCSFKFYCLFHCLVYYFCFKLDIKVLLYILNFFSQFYGLISREYKLYPVIIYVFLLCL